MEFTPSPKLTWPLEVEKSGTSHGTWQYPVRPSADEVRFTWHVQAYEDVHVVAGTFKAFRISIVIDRLRGPGYQGITPGSWKFVTWYTPEVRQFVKAEGFGMNLLAFQVVALEEPAPGLLQVALQEPMEQVRFTTQGIVVAGKVTGGKGGDLGQRHPQWRRGLQARGATGTQERHNTQPPDHAEGGEERAPRHGRRSGGEHRSGGPRDLLRQANAISIPASPCPRRLPRSPA